jgi:hypothetical protein
LSNIESSKPTALEEDIENDVNSVERPEHPGGSQAVASAFPSRVHEPGDDHYVISTGTYYQAELSDFGDLSDEDGQEWESDGEAGEI